MCCSQRNIVAGLFTAVLPLVCFGQGYEAQHVKQVAEQADVANRAYELLSPAKLSAGEKYPAIVYLHGAGAKGSDNRRPAKEPLPRMLASEDARTKYPCFVIVPQCQDGADETGRPHNWVKWRGQAELPPAQWEIADAEPSAQLRAAITVLDDAVQRHPIDPRRIYLAGVSMGASGAWYWAAHEPGRFAGVVAVCGLSESTKSERLKSVPIWAFHGTEDDVVPVERSRQMMAALRSAKSPAKYTEYEGAGHNIATRVALEPALMEWLFAQKQIEPKQIDSPRATVEADFFEKKIRPLLVTHCHKCHGPEKQEGKLRLDSLAAALKGGEYGPAIVPGKPADGWLVKAISYKDEALQMPPTGKLSEAAIRDLTEWVQRGANWPEHSAVDKDVGSNAAANSTEMAFTPGQKSHWAFQPMQRPAGLNSRSITAFIDQQLERDGPPIAPAADRRTLLRRISFDLTGLPPTPNEMKEFLGDETAEAYSRVIERLLASPHYGERWGRHWLDVARYADSNGSEIDHAMGNAWRYRDYVVRAMNADKPFDRFAREQIAGDLLSTEGDPQANLDRVIATGFLMLGPKALADLDKERLLADVIDEQVDTVGRAFMGLTLGCCRCHDHKFDPLPAADYYALAGIFKSTRTIDVSKRVATWSERPLGSTADLSRVERLVSRIGDLRAQRDAAGAAPARKKLILPADAPYVAFEAEDFIRANVRVERDNLGRGIGVLRTLMEYPDHIEYEVEISEEAEYQLELRYAAKESRPTQIIINGNLEEMEAAAEITGDWTPGAQRWFIQGVYQFKAGKNVLTLHRDGPVPMFDKLLIGKPNTQGYGPTAKMTSAKPGGDVPSKQQLDEALAAARQELEAIPTTLAPLEGNVVNAPILARGNPAMAGAIVPRGFPRIISGVEAEEPGPSESGRRELANWLTQSNHPLTARVIVNRVWQWHFGEGLVRTPDNFGLRGEAPAHPELLDGLAIWFVENGWSLKKLHRAICASRAYCAASVEDGEAGTPSQRFFSRRRLEAEELRDAMLAATGLLDRTIGGSLMTVMNRTYANGGDAAPDIAKQMHYDTPRRSLYLPIVRNALYDFFAVFDYPEPGMLTGQRATTTVAPQALFLMNSPFVQQQAAALAEKVQPLASDNLGRIRAAYELAFSRPPREWELLIAQRFLQQEAARSSEATVIDSERAAWRRFCQALLASNDFLYVR